MGFRLTYQEKWYSKSSCDKGDYISLSEHFWPIKSNFTVKYQLKKEEDADHALIIWWQHRVSEASLVSNSIHSAGVQFSLPSTVEKFNFSVEPIDMNFKNFRPNHSIEKYME